MRPLALTLISAALVLAASSNARGAVFNVASGDVNGLVAAVNAANANGEADTINLAAGTYTLTTPATAQTGLPDITSEIALIGAGSATTVLTRDTGAANFRLINVAETGELRIEGLTLSHGTAPDRGGAISSAGSLTVVDCVLTANRSPFNGGGIAQLQSAGGSLVIEGSTLSANNSNSDRGSALFVSSPLVLRGSQVTGNVSTGGGAIFWTTNAGNRALIEDSQVEGNTGGGIDAFAGAGLLELVRTTIDGNDGPGMNLSGNSLQVFVTDSTISNNTAPQGGGLIVGTKLVLRRSTVSGNTATSNVGGGGGIFVVNEFGSSDLTVESSTISGNSAAASGGGIDLVGALPRDQRVRIQESTITGNTADSDSNGSGAGGGIATGGGDVELVDSIVGGNLDQSGTANDCAGQISSQGHNLIGDAAGCGFASAPGDVVGAAPLLGALAANGGPTQTHLPLAGSPAIDAADPTRCGAPDQRFFARPVDGNGDTIARCDIGAVEAGSATPVVFLADDFLCYAARTSQRTPALPALSGVSLLDDFEGKNFDVRKSTALCTPGDAFGFGLVDPDTHLHGRAIRESVGEPRHTRQLGVLVTNELGAFRVDTVRPDSLLVPAAKGLDAFPPPPDPMDHNLDRYKCYQAKTSSGAPKLARGAAAIKVGLSNQFFAGRVFTLNKVTRLCTSVDEEGQGRKNPSALLLCFQARSLKPLLPGDVDQTIVNLHVADEWGTEQLDAKRSFEICVSSLRAF